MLSPVPSPSGEESSNAAEPPAIFNTSHAKICFRCGTPFHLIITFGENLSIDERFVLKPPWLNNWSNIVS